MRSHKPLLHEPYFTWSFFMKATTTSKNINQKQLSCMVVLYEEPLVLRTPALPYMVLLMKSHYHLQEYQSKTTSFLRGPAYEEPLASRTRALPYMVLLYEEPLTSKNINQRRLASYVVLLFEEPLASRTRALPYMVLLYEEPLPLSRISIKDDYPLTWSFFMKSHKPLLHDLTLHGLSS